jgi:hypothetical protein
MIFVTFISIHFVIICGVLLWRTYETHPALSLKYGCDNDSSPQSIHVAREFGISPKSVTVTTVRHLAVARAL